MAVVGVDVGGTFTDVVSWDGSTLTTTKLPTTSDPAVGVAAGVGAGDATLLHGTTVATNALLQRRGATTALVTSPGFEDVLEIGRQDRPSLYDPAADRPPPLVPRSRRFALPADALAAAPEAIAVALIDAHRDGSAEREIGRELSARLPGAGVSLSSEVSGEMREFERTSTTVLNAYLQPVVAGYLRRLAEVLGHLERLSVMRSSGGLMSIGRATQLPAAALLSGPAGGVVAAAALATALGRDRVVSFDMGGTSTDVARIENGRPEVSYERAIDGYACRMPAVAVHTVGAGGGSIAWIDPGGALQVGPMSAGAAPGPAAYRRGGNRPTVTDANAVLGRLPAELAGHIRLDLDGAAAAIEALGIGPSGEVAAGIITVVEDNMARAIRRVSVEEGVDPADATLVAFGGAGGLHAAALAQGLGMASVVVPPAPGAFSALGLLLSPVRADVARAVAPTATTEEVSRAAATAATDARRELDAMTGASAGAVGRFLDMRYRGQSHELTVPWEDDLGVAHRRFEDLHRERNGFARPGDPIEVVAARAEAVGPPAATLTDLTFEPDGRDPRRGTTQVLLDGSVIEADLWWRPSLDGEIAGPAVVVEPTATTLVRAGERAIVHPGGALELQWH